VTRIAYFDCASGASGDMVLGALVDLGLPLDRLRAELAKLPLAGYRLEARKVERAGLSATKVDVVIEGQDRRTDGHGDGDGDGDARGHGHTGAHTHEHGHSDDHGHGHGAGDAIPHGHRGLGEILHMIETSGLEATVKDRSSALFRRLAEAEASVHGTSPEEVTFHEIGAIDSIVDVVGAVIGLGWLDVDRFMASPLNVGTGTVRMAHGEYPIPPPATLRLVAGVPVYGSGQGELLTPTGALLVTAHATGYGPLPALRPEGAGHGAGTRDTPGRPNVLRLIVGEEAAASDGQRVVVIESEIDDMSPQLFGPLMDHLLAAGALDAFYTPVQMKKGRPGVLLTVVTEPKKRTAIEEVLFTETTTLGLRWQEWDRTTLDREAVLVETEYGPVAVKVGSRQGRVYNVQPEFEACLARARATSRPVKEIWAAALAAYHARKTAGA
jgi:uncharacterized protein (TIGR00299 family) protein